VESVNLVLMPDEVQPIPDSDDVLVLLDYASEAKVFPNLLRRRADGTEVWRAAPPDPSGPDAWVAARIDRDTVIANSWSGWHVILDLATGTERSRTYAK
jgi:hypothetical protein